LKSLPPGGRLIGIDADKNALRIAEENLHDFRDSVILVHENFRRFDTVLRKLEIDAVDGMLFDLGMSSLQLQDAVRGFSFSREGVLDMRMDTDNGKPLWQILDSLSEDEIAKIIRDLGEERFWRRIARRIVSERKNSPIKNPLTLAGLVRDAVGSRRQRIDPATRTFQAFRIYINDELGALTEALDKSPQFLRKDGRIVVIAFHSLEDRIVKNKFRDLGKEGILKILTKKPIRPSSGEAEENPRSRSARLRAAERLKGG
jgi:16S rRNA (cytosine1402-N4)-methyltransferase